MSCLVYLYLHIGWVLTLLICSESFGGHFSGWIALFGRALCCFCAVLAARQEVMSMVKNTC